MCVYIMYDVTTKYCVYASTYYVYYYAIWLSCNWNEKDKGKSIKS